MKRIFIVIIAIIFLPTLVHAEVVYLKCSPEKRNNFFVKIDKSSGKITHTQPSSKGNHSYNAEGFLAPNMISYKFTSGTPGDVIWIEHEYHINPATLQFEGKDVMKTDMPKSKPNPHETKGACEIVKIEGRKF